MAQLVRRSDYLSFLSTCSIPFLARGGKNLVKSKSTGEKPRWGFFSMALAMFYSFSVLSYILVNHCLLLKIISLE